MSSGGVKLYKLQKFMVWLTMALTFLYGILIITAKFTCRGTKRDYCSFRKAGR